MTEQDLEKAEELIFQIRYLLSQGNCPNGLVSVCANEEDAAALERIVDYCRNGGAGAKMSREECLAAVNSFNEACRSLPSVKVLTDGRIKALQGAKRILGETSFAELFRRAEASDFISGRSGKWKGASFDWIIKKANLVKILEGNYDNARQGVQASSFEFDEFWAAAMSRSARIINEATGG